MHSRRRVHAFTSSLRSAVKVTLNTGGEFDLIKKPSAEPSAPKSAFDFVLGRREANDGSQPSDDASLDFGGRGIPSKEANSPQGSNRCGQGPP